jgi:transcriptional regulator of arginine metabolism
MQNLDVYARSMQNGRDLGKAERQRLIAGLIARKRIGTQFELIDALASQGCSVTQATVSRDIRELGLEKVHDALGRPRYVAPQTARGGDPRETLAAILAQFGRHATAAGNLVVVQSELGSAPAIARALDRIEHARIVGTLAGDDTCLVVTADVANARAVARELAGLMG